jgi:hypothetical protein
MLLFMDGQSHYDTIEAKYSRLSPGDATWEVVPEGRAQNAIRRTNIVSSEPSDAFLVMAPRMTRLGPWAPTKGGVCGFAFRVNDLNRLTGLLPQLTPVDLFVVMEGTAHHLKVSLTPNGSFLLRGRKKNPTGQELLLAQSVEGIQSGAWNYIEFAWYIDATAGSFQVRLNGTTIINFTGDTDQSSPTDPPIAFQGIWTAIQFFGFFGSATLGQPDAFTAWFCDLYLADTAAGVAGDIDSFMGDGQMITIFPSGVGLAADWAPHPAGPNFDQVNDNPVPDGDDTYVSTLTPAARDCYVFEDIPAGATVLAVHYNLLLRKEDAGSARVAPIAAQAAVQYVAPDQGVGADTYSRYLSAPYDVNPATNLTWTAPEINAGQWGLVRTA